MKSLRAGTAITCVLAFCGPMGAQSALAQDSNDGGLNEIVVTASKRSAQRIIDTPQTIQAISGEDLTTNQIQQFSDYARSISGLSFEDQGPGDKKYVLRGVQSVGAGTVGVYFDEIVTTGQNRQDGGGHQPDLRLVDMERLEVLKGPQGTLYGASSMSGTIRMITNKPDLDKASGAFNADGSQTAHASQLNYSVDGMLNVPVIEGKLGVRVVAYKSFNAGYINNLLLGEKDVNNVTISGARLAVRAAPTERLTLDFMAITQTTKADDAAWYQPAFGYLDTNNFTSIPYHEKLDAYSLTANWKAASGTITATGSYMERTIDFREDATRKICAIFGTPANNPACNTNATSPLLEGFRTAALQPVTRDIVSSELRYASDWSGAFQFVGGLFYNKEREKFHASIPPILATGEVIPQLNTWYANRSLRSTTEQMAAFGELSYKLTSRLTATVGGRYFKFTIDQDSQNLQTRSRPDQPHVYTNSKENGFNPKFNLSYKVTDSVLAYATYSEGFRSGGTNAPNPRTGEENPPFRSDSLKNYEFGVKGEFLNRRLQVEAAIYQMDWSDLQALVTTSSSTTITQNVGAARIRGIEINSSARPIKPLTLGANLAFLQPELAEDDPANVTGRTRALKGDRIPNVPKFSGNAFAEYMFDAPMDSTATAHIDYSYVGRSYTDFSPQSPLYYPIGKYSLINARLTFERGPVQVAIFANNVFNTRAVQSLALIDTQRPTAAVPLQPRTVGLRLGAKF